MVEKEKVQMRKRNMKLYPIYKTLSWDYLFFYTTNFLFLTGVKHIAPADVVLIDSFYALFGIIMQVPATFVIEYLGRKRSLILANFLNCIYMLVIMFSTNLFNLITAEILSSLAFGIKETVDPALLNESIPPSRYKSKIFAKISQKGTSSYYMINAITTVLAGFFYDINPYIPITLSFIITLLVTIISTGFIDPQNENKKHKIQEFNQLKDLKDSFKFILKSERLKALILFSAISGGVISLMATYEVSLLEDFNMPAKYLCMIFAILGIISGIAAKRQESFHERYKNKSLSALLGVIGGTVLGAGICGIIAKQYSVFILFVVVTYMIRYSYQSMYYPLTERYLRNFSNEKIDTKIFTARNFLKSILSAVIGIIGSFLLERINISYCMLIIGVSTIILTILMSQYMKTRVGLKPQEYAKEELQFDELANK